MGGGDWKLTCIFNEQLWNVIRQMTRANHQDPVFLKFLNPVGPSEGFWGAVVSPLGHKNDEP